MQTRTAIHTLIHVALYAALAAIVWYAITTLSRESAALTTVAVIGCLGAADTRRLAIARKRS